MKVLLADDCQILTRGLLSVLSVKQNIDKIYEASSRKDEVDILERYKPDIAVVDMTIGNDDTIEIIKYAKENKINTKFLILTSSSKKYDFERAKKAGVYGYILKDALAEEILYAFSLVSRGKKFFHTDVLGLTEYGGKKHIELLTKREKEVFFQVAKGLSNNMIAEKLYISENTVKKHVSNILSKLNLSYRTQIVLLAKDIA